MESKFDSSKYVLAEAPAPQNTDLIHSVMNGAGREFNAVGGGLIDGLAKTGSQTLSDVSNGAKAWAHDPLGTTGDYLSHHWQEGVAGAAISLMAPRAWVNKLLVAYSLRGLAASTGRTMMLAADSSNNISEVRNFYGDSIAHEGTSLLSSLPMTMAGGVAGKVGANALFGKNMGLSDTFLKTKNSEGEVVPPPVDGDYIAGNLKNLRYKVSPPEVKRVYTDMDNTILDFSTFEAKGVDNGIAQVAKNLAEAGHPISEQELYKSIGGAMDKARSHDYPWSVELALSDRLKVGEPGGMSVERFNDLAVKPFWNAIDSSRRDNISLLPGAEDSLKQLKAANKEVVIVSDAPSDAAMLRLKTVKFADGSPLIDHVDRIYALNNSHEPAGLSEELLAHGRERVRAALDNAPDKFTGVPKNWEKPKPNSILMDLENHPGPDGKPLDPRQTIMIGDSRTKDVKVAGNAGMQATWRRGEPNNALWAEYGNPIEGGYAEQVLSRLRPLPENEGAPATGPKVYPSQLEAATSYSDLLKYLKPKPDYGYLAESLGKSLMVTPPWQAALGYNWQPSLADVRPLYARTDELLKR